MIKTQHSFWIKTLSTLGLERVLQPDRGIYKNLQPASFLLAKGWMLPPRPGTRQGGLLLPLMSHTVLETRPEKETQGVQVRKAVAVSADVVLNAGNPTEPTK